MRTENVNKELLLSREASGAITRNRVCKDVAGAKVAQCGVLGEKGTCVARYDAEDGRAVSAQYGPTNVLIEAGAPIADNTEFIVDTTGRIIDAAGAAVGSWVLGKTNNGSSASAAGQLVSTSFYGESARQTA